MSKIGTLYGFLDFVCPHCGEYIEIYEIDVSVTVFGADVSRLVDECVFTYECEHCSRKFRVTPHMDIDVEAV